MSRPIDRARRYGRLYANVMESRLSPRAKLLAPIIDWHAPRRRVTTIRLMGLLNCSARTVRYVRQELAAFYRTGGQVITPWKNHKPVGMRTRGDATAGGGNGLPHYSPESSLEEEKIGLYCGNGLPPPTSSGVGPLTHKRPNWQWSRTAWRRHLAADKTG